MLLSAAVSLSDNPIPLDPVGVEFSYEHNMKVALKGERNLSSLVLTENGKSIPVPPSELEGVSNPLLSKVIFYKTLDYETERPLAVVSFESQPELHPWGSTVRKVSFYFVDGAYSRRTIEVPTGRDTWEYRTKKVGKPEESGSRGGAIPTSPEK